MQTHYLFCADMMLCICRRSLAKLSSAEEAVDTNVTITDTHPACKLVQNALYLSIQHLK